MSGDVRKNEENSGGKLMAQQIENPDELVAHRGFRILKQGTEAI
jgi:hypothetical protein